jgi:23S rRNA (guanosine2251-2'-O)-methyltransferase
VLIYGYHPVREALRRRPGDVARVLLAARRGGRRAEEVAELGRRAGVECVRVASGELDRLAPGVHNGFAAELRSGEPAAAGGDPDLIVLLEDVQDPRNLGAILRVCEAAGVGRVLIRDRGSAPLSPTVIKSAAGATEWLAVDRVPNSAAALARLKEAGYWVHGAVVGGEAPWEVDLTGKVVLCLGGEEDGLRAHTRDVCDRLVGLPMLGEVGSLNVATAAAGLLYEAVRQRRAPSGPRPGPGAGPGGA